MTPLKAYLETTESRQIGPESWHVTKAHRVIEFDCPELEKALNEGGCDGNDFSQTIVVSVSLTTKDEQ